MVVAKEACIPLIWLTASGTWEEVGARGRGCSIDGVPIIVCNYSRCVRVTSGTVVRIDEVVSEEQEILHCHPFSVCKGSAGLSLEAR